jgi:hypothetical protein
MNAPATTDAMSQAWAMTSSAVRAPMPADNPMKRCVVRA